MNSSRPLLFFVDHRSQHRPSSAVIRHPPHRSSSTLVILHIGHPPHRSSSTSVILHIGHPAHQPSYTFNMFCIGLPSRLRWAAVCHSASARKSDSDGPGHSRCTEWPPPAVSATMNPLRRGGASNTPFLYP